MEGFGIDTLIEYYEKGKELKNAFNTAYDGLTKVILNIVKDSDLLTNPHVEYDKLSHKLYFKYSINDIHYKVDVRKFSTLTSSVKVPSDRIDIEDLIRMSDGYN